MTTKGRSSALLVVIPEGNLLLLLERSHRHYSAAIPASFITVFQLRAVLTVFSFVSK